jgi:hypothetical protein
MPQANLLVTLLLAVHQLFYEEGAIPSHFKSINKPLPLNFKFLNLLLKLRDFSIVIQQPFEVSNFSLVFFNNFLKYLLLDPCLTAEILSVF